MFESINPATGQVLAQHSAMSAEVLAAALEEAGTSAMAWSRVDVSVRASMLEDVAALLEAKQDAFARLITQEVGKPLAEARAELDKCALLCRYYAAHASEFLADESVDGSAKESHLSYQPLGVVLGIMPWNFPFWQVFRFAVPVLAAGNTALLKHAPNVCGCALAIEALFQEAGYPEGVLRALLIEIDQVDALERDAQALANKLCYSFYGYESVGGKVIRLANGASLHYLQGGFGDIVDVDKATYGCAAAV